MAFSFVGMKSNASLFSSRQNSQQNSQSSKLSEASERQNPFSSGNFTGNSGGGNFGAEPMEDDISPYDSVSNWGEEQMEQSFESKGSSSPMKNHDASMRSDAMSILSEAVATTVTTASIVLKARAQIFLVALRIESRAQINFGTIKFCQKRVLICFEPTKSLCLHCCLYEFDIFLFPCQKSYR